MMVAAGRILVAVVALASTTQGVAHAADDPLVPGATYTSQKVDWTSEACPESLRNRFTDGKENKHIESQLPAGARLLCAKVIVPKDYAHQSLGNLTLMVSKVSKGDEKGKRALFYNPGGPGGSGLNGSIRTARSNPKFLDDHVLVGIDVRGTGDSDKAPCKQDVSTQKGVDACAKEHDVVKYLNTEQTARDLDLIRQLMGQDQIDYLGVSYGTYLGRYYQYFFPKQSGRFVLDSNTNFAKTHKENGEFKDKAFQRRFDKQFLPWVARHDDLFKLGKTAAAVGLAYERIRDAVKKNSVEGLTESELSTSWLDVMYTNSKFESFATALRHLDEFLKETKGADTKAKKTKAQETKAAASAVAAEIKSLIKPKDSASTTTLRAVRANDDGRIKFTGAYKGNPLPRIGNKAADGSPMPLAVMVQGEFDAPTYLEGAGEAHRTGNTRLVLVVGEGTHGIYGSDWRSTEVEEIVNSYLSTGTAPEKDRIVYAAPLPLDPPKKAWSTLKITSKDGKSVVKFEDELHEVTAADRGTGLYVPADPEPGT